MSLSDKIKKHITNVPFEGQEVDIEGLEEMIKGLLVGMVTFAHSYESTDKGYFKHDKNHSRKEIVEKFINYL